MDTDRAAIIICTIFLAVLWLAVGIAAHVEKGL